MSQESNEILPIRMLPQVAYEWSLAVALATGALPNYCYDNVWHAMTELEELTDAFLIEGWVVLEQEHSISLVEHCWCEHENRIIDPSLVLLVGREQAPTYFAGIRRDRSEIRFLTCEQLPRVRSLGSYGYDGMGHTGYRAAFGAAYKYAATCASPHGSSIKPIVVQPSRASAPKERNTRLVVQIVSSHDFLTGRR